MAWAITSFPVPDSPLKTEAELLAALTYVAQIFFIGSLSAIRRCFL
jgi:hypothetical protein